MSTHIGIDLGTSNCAIARVSETGHLETLPITEKNPFSLPQSTFPPRANFPRALPATSSASSPATEARSNPTASSSPPKVGSAIRTPTAAAPFCLGPAPR
jgi:molecular chaperone DnaK (HSP70)